VHTGNVLSLLATLLGCGLKVLCSLVTTILLFLLLVTTLVFVLFLLLALAFLLFLTFLALSLLLLGLLLLSLFFWGCSFSVKKMRFVNLRVSEVHLFYNLQLFYWHFLEILWLFIFLVLYLY